MNGVRGMYGMVGVLALSGVSALGQTVPTPKAETTEAPKRYISCPTPDACTVQTFYLANETQPNEMNEVVTALRNLMPPDTKMFLVPSRAAILVEANAAELALAKQVIGELDKPRKTYRLTYTITEMEGDKKVNAQRFAIIVADGQRVTLKQGSKVPVATGSYNAVAANGNGPGSQTQFTYLDIGMNFDATLNEVAGGAQLKTKVEQSGVAEEHSIAGVQEPVIRQTVFEGTSFLKMGKAQMLGSVDVPGSTRHLDIEVVMEVVQ